jgi:hypothetical protein
LFAATSLVHNTKLSHLQRFLAPRDVENIALLTWEAKDGNDDQWLYLPATRNPERIAAAWASRTMHNGIPDTEVRPSPPGGWPKRGEAAFGM